MASLKKISQGNVCNIIRHNERLNQNYSNPDVNLDKKNLDYSLSPDRGMTNYDYYKQRLSECYVYNRSDVKTVFSWVVTCPEDTPDSQTDLFFCNIYDFLNERYGEKNCISCTVHKDESGRPHMHYLAIPVVPDPKHPQGIKVCCDKVINRRELRNFHPDLDRYLKNNGIKGSVYTGITKRQGGNRSIRELKQNREIQRERQVERQVERRW